MPPASMKNAPSPPHWLVRSIGSAAVACRKWREAHPERVLWLDTDNRRYRIDIDTPEDLARFAASTGHTMTWPQASASDAIA